MGQARQRGIAPDSPEEAEVVDRLVAGADPARRDYILERLSAGSGLLPPAPLYLRRPDAAVPGPRKQVTPA